MDLINKFIFLFIITNLLLIVVKMLFKFEYNKNILSCGIFGVSLKTNGSRKIALQKFKILGLYNIKRGKDASGVFVNGEIIKGIGKISEFDDFIEDYIIPEPKESGIMLGHTRQGSWGYKKTIDEAHPFLINESMVFTHNGTIKNTEELCKKYNLNEKEFSVDSQILGTIINTNGPKVLEDYVGAAALAWTNIEESDTIFLYHGKSKEYKHGAVLEERPLYFLETKDGLYYSSLEESLFAIRENEKEVPYCLKYNTVFTIKNGKILTDLSVIIEREEKNVTEYVIPSRVGKYMKTPTNTTTHTKTYTNNRNSKRVSITDEELIKRETLPLRVIEEKEKSGFIYHHFGRYWDAPRTLLRGPIYLKKGGYHGKHDDKISVLTFFWDGIMLKGKEEYMKLLALSQEKLEGNWVVNTNKHNFALRISKYTSYPVTNIGADAYTLSDFYKNQWYLNGESAGNMNITPNYANGRNYKFNNGFLMQISASQREKTLWDTKKLAQEEIQAFVDGNLLPRISGGGSQATPFLLGNSTTKNTEEDQRDDNELIWWYDVPFSTIKAGMEEVGELELQSLRDYSTIVWKRDFKVDPLEKEIDEFVSDIFEECLKNRCSIMYLIKDNEEKQILEDCYEKIIEKQNQKDFNSIILKNSIIVDVEDEFDEEEIEEKIETSINSLEDLQATSMDLMNAQKSDCAQECAKIIITGTSTMLCNMENVLGDFKKNDFVNRVKKIREVKNVKNGIL